MLERTYPYLDKSIIDYINVATKDRNDFDERKFSDWLANSDVKNKNNPSGYVKACFRKELVKGTFTYKPIVSNKLSDDNAILSLFLPTLYKYLPLFDVDIREGFGDETFFVENLQLYIYKNDILSIDELNLLNNKVMGYITTFENPQLSDYRDYIKKAQALKGKVDWNEIDQIELNAKQEFDELIKEMERNEDD